MPQQIQDFANHFIAMQIKRHEADYDPKGKYHKSAVINDIAATESCMKLFVTASVKDRRAFAAWVLLKPPRTN